MSEGKLKTAILGLDENGLSLLDAIGQVEHFELIAVADKDTNLAEKIATEYKCDFYDDYRQLIKQNQLDCLLVAESIHSCDEYVRMAMKKKFNVLKIIPAGRNFEEADELVALSEAENVRFTVATVGRFAHSYLTLRRFLQEGIIEVPKGTNLVKGDWEPFLLTVFCKVGDYPHYNWQTDPKLAGGGVLLHNCYSFIDQIVWNFGLPEQVYSLGTNQAHDKKQRLYLTEDTIVVTIKFSDTFIGNIIASRRDGIGPSEEILTLYGKDMILTVNDSQLTVRDSDGRICADLKYENDRCRYMAELLQNFALSIISPDNNVLFSSGRDNLKNMAVIESAYLSARTGFPEEPGRILQMSAQH